MEVISSSYVLSMQMEAEAREGKGLAKVMLSFMQTWVRMGSPNSQNHILPLLAPPIRL